MWAMINGEKTTVGLFRMDKGVDSVLLANSIRN